jgi:nitrogen-specific signal transduction histidine kinase
MARAFALPFRTAAGKILPLDVTTRVIGLDGGLSALMAARDATPRLALELMRQDEVQLRAVRVVANTAAHEINNPLSVILGSLELLRGRLTGDTEARWVERALSAAQRLAEIADRLDGIHTLERLRREQGLGPALDLRRSSTPA